MGRKIRERNECVSLIHVLFCFDFAAVVVEKLAFI